MLQAGIVPHVPDDPGAVRRPGPSVGQPTDEILAEVGLAVDGIGSLRRDGAVA